MYHGLNWYKKKQPSYHWAKFSFICRTLHPIGPLDWRRPPLLTPHKIKPYHSWKSTKNTSNNKAQHPHPLQISTKNIPKTSQIVYLGLNTYSFSTNAYLLRSWRRAGRPRAARAQRARAHARGRAARACVCTGLWRRPRCRRVRAALTCDVVPTKRGVRPALMIPGLRVAGALLYKVTKLSKVQSGQVHSVV